MFDDMGRTGAETARRVKTVSNRADQHVNLSRLKDG